MMRSTAKLSIIISTALFLLLLLFSQQSVKAAPPPEYIFPNTDIQTDWSVNPINGHYGAIDEYIASPTTSDYIYTIAAGKTDEWGFTPCPSDVGTVTTLTVRLHMKRASPGLVMSLDVNWTPNGTDYSSTKNTGTFPTSETTVDLTWDSLSLSKSECDALQVQVRSKTVSAGIPVNHYIYTANVNITYDEVPTVTLSLPSDSSTDTDGNVTFACNVTDDNIIENVTLYHNISGSWSANQTKNSIVTEQFFENCNDISDWGVSGGWASSSGQCRDNTPSSTDTMTSQTIDLSADNIYANLTFYYDYEGNNAGDYLKVYVNSSVDSFTEIFSVGGISSTVGSAEINLSEYITLNSGVHLRAVCNIGIAFNSIHCIWDNINVTSYNLDNLGASYNATFNEITGISDGYYKWNCLAYDNASGSDWASSNWTFTVDATSPQYSNNQTNTTIAGEPTLFSLYWTDTMGLSGYIFSFDNGTGTFSNDSWVAMTGASNWSNVTKIVNSTVGSTIRWIVYANDTANNWVTSDTYQYITNTPPTVTLSSPPDSSTDTDGGVTFACNVTDDIKIENVTLYHNISGSWSANQTFSTPIESFENCDDISDWTVTGGWASVSNQCKDTTTTENNMTSQPIDLSADNINYANLTFYYSVDLGIGPYFKVYVNSSTDDWTQVFAKTKNTSSGTAEINLSEYITIDSGVHLKGSCNPGIDDYCIWDNINITSYMSDPNNYSNTSYNVTFNPLNNIPDGSYKWNCLAYDNASGSAWADSNFTFTVELCSPPADSDWNITTDVTCQDKVIYIAQDKDLNVLGGGSLTLINTTLWINQTSDGSSEIHVWSGGAMNITDNSSDGSLINSTNASDEFNFIVDSGSNFSMTSSRLEESGWSGSNPGLEINTTVTEFSGNTLKNNYIGVTFSSDNNVVSSNTIDSSQKYGISLSGNGNTLTGNNISNTNGSSSIYGIYLTSTSNNNIIIQTAISNTTTAISGAYGILLSTSDNNTITDANITNTNAGTNTASGIGLFGANNNTITQTTITNANANNSAYGILLSNSDNNTITDANITNTSAGTNSTIGIYLSGSSNNNITQATITDTSAGNGKAYGVYLSIGANNNTITQTTITNANANNSAYGILLSNSDNNTITDANITNTNAGTYGAYGVQLATFSSNNTITQTTITNTSAGDEYAQGIILSDSSNNNIIGLTITSVNAPSTVLSVYLSNAINNTFIDSKFMDYDITSIYSTTASSINTFINTTFNKSATDIQGGVIYVKWYLDISVTNILRNPIKNANVTAWDNSGILAFSELTDKTGRIVRQNVTEFFENATSKYFLTNYTLNTTKVGYTDSRQLNITESMSLNIQLDIYFSFQVTLNINNTNNTVYIPVQWVGEKSASQLGPGANYTNHTHNYLASYNSTGGGLAALVAQWADSLFISNTTTYHTIKIEQNLSNPKIFLAFTKGDWETINNRMNLIETGQFLAKISPSFAFGLGIYYPIKMLLNYSDIDIQGNLILQRGLNKLSIESNSTEGAKRIVIKRV